VGCRRERAKSELVRIAVDAREGRAQQPLAVLDRDARLAGRGAYLCRREPAAEPAASCLQSAIRRGAIPRALRSAVALDPKLVESVSR
jgi:predicted RNA-binding protein YlxR (DUF448 family)